MSALADIPPMPVSEDQIGEVATPTTIEKPLPPLESLKSNREDGKVELPAAYCRDQLGFAFPTWKKWLVLSNIFFVQCSMNFNASVYGNAVKGLKKQFGISGQMARVGQMIFLVAYGFGSEFWAPWSEEYGRKMIMQLSLGFVNLWQIPCALSQSFTGIIIGRFLGGLSSAGGSVTLGMVADLYDVENHQYALNFIVLSSCGGSALGPIFGALVEKYLSWRWVFWVQLIFGLVAQATHYWLVPETRETTLIDREAKRLRKSDPNKYGRIYGPGELAPKLDRKQIITIWVRPFKMFLKESIVFCLSLLSGFSDALIFLFIDSFHDVFAQWNFNTIQFGLTFVVIIVGYLIAFLLFLPPIRRDMAIRKQNPHRLKPESRLWLLLWLAPLLPGGLLGFAFASFGPPVFHWMVPLTFAFFIAIANYAIYMATIDYMVAAYGVYSASATGGNALARDVLAGLSSMYSEPMFNRIGSKEMQLFWPSIILFILASCITVPVYVIYWKGPAIRARSVFACELARLREVTEAASRSGTLADPDQIARIRNRFSTTNQSLGLRTPRHSIALATPRHSVEQRDDHAANIAESRGPSQE